MDWEGRCEKNLLTICILGNFARQLYWIKFRIVGPSKEPPMEKCLHLLNWSSLPFELSPNKSDNLFTFPQRAPEEDVFNRK